MTPVATEVRPPDNLGLALAALGGGMFTAVLSATVLASSGGRFFVALGSSVCALVAVVRALRARFAGREVGLDARAERRARLVRRDISRGQTGCA
jgi:hypothetical protein